MRANYVRAFYLPKHNPPPSVYVSHYEARHPSHLKRSTSCACGRDKDINQMECLFCQGCDNIIESARNCELNEAVLNILKPLSCFLCENRFDSYDAHVKSVQRLQNVSSDNLKLISAESVTNKDRMAVEPLLELTSEKLIDCLSIIENVFVTMTLIPDRYRIRETNKRGLYEHPFAICTASTGKIICLNWKTNTGSSDLVQLRLHSPADSKVLARNLKAVGISLCYMQGVALFCGGKKFTMLI